METKRAVRTKYEVINKVKEERKVNETGAKNIRVAKRKRRRQ